MLNQDDRTSEEIAATVPGLPVLKSVTDARGRTQWRYDGPKAGESVDPATIATPRSVRPGLDFARMQTEDYVPKAVLARLRVTDKDGRMTPVPHWELKGWERKYAIGFEILGGHHFDVNDAWRNGQDPGGYFDVRRAAERAVARLVVDEKLAAIDRAEPVDRVESVGIVGAAPDPTPVRLDNPNVRARQANR